MRAKLHLRVMQLEDPTADAFTKQLIRSQSHTPSYLKRLRGMQPRAALATDLLAPRHRLGILILAMRRAKLSHFAFVSLAM